MNDYIKILNIAIPIFVSLVLLEWIIAYFKNKKYLRSIDVVSSLSSGLTNILKDVLGLTLIIISYSWLVKHLAIFHVPQTIWTFVIVFILKDFAQYWSHRWEHKINIFWNRHIVHHSSEDFNLACALRQPISNLANIFVFLYIPMALIGVPTIVVATVAPLHLFAQFWYHTQLIHKMGFLEHIIVTPSAHRVHHAINNEYLDKNFSAIFIIWDKIFGTYQAELDDVPPVYGVKRPVRTWNPIIINFQHLFLLIRDAWYTKSWKDKFRIWFMPTGFRPKDVEKRFPVESIDDIYQYKKYETTNALPLRVYAWSQLLIHLFMMLYLFNNMESFSANSILVYGFFLFVSIFSFTSLLDGSKWALLTEILKLIIVAFVVLSTGTWYNIETLWGYAMILFICYLLANLVFILVVLYTKFFEFQHFGTTTKL